MINHSYSDKDYDYQWISHNYPTPRTPTLLSSTIRTHELQCQKLWYYYGNIVRKIRYQIVKPVTPETKQASPLNIEILRENVSVKLLYPDPKIV